MYLGSDTQEDNVEIRSIGYHQLIRHGEFVAYPSPTYNTNEPIMSHFSGPRKDIRRCQSMTNGNARHGEVVKYNGNVGNYDGSRSDGWITDSGTEDDYEIAWRKRAMTSTERENKRRMIEATEIAAVLEARGRELRDRERRAGFVRF